MSLGASPPRAAQRPVERVVHGATLVDRYAWLRADNWRQVMRRPRALAKDIRAYLTAENDHAKAWFAPLRSLRTQLFREMRGRIKENDASVPMPDGAWAYSIRYRDGGEHPLLCRRPRDEPDDSRESILIDGDALAAGKSYFQLGPSAHSPDHRRLAWSADERGSELRTIRVRDIASGTDLSDTVPDTTGEVVWAADGQAFYYVRLDEEHRPLRVYRHRLGTPAEDDMLVYAEADTGFFVGIERTQSCRFLTINVHDHRTSEVHLVDLEDPSAKPRLVAPREVDVEYSVQHDDDRLFILTNADGAEDFKLVEAPLATPERSHWRDLVPHRSGNYILDHTVFRDFLVRGEREDGLPRIVVRDRGDGTEHAIAFEEEAYALSMSAGFEFATSTLRFTYASMTTPTEIYDYDMRTRKRVLRKRQEVPSGHDPMRYVTRRLQAPTMDGETVPISLVMRRDVPLDGTAPLYLYGYGAYGIAMSAGFRTAPLSLVDRGMIYAIAHVRGGSEKGRRWYKDGKLEKKVNTFTDFIAAAEHLIASGYTAKGRIVAHGGSAGGMLVGAVANLRPDLFAGIVAEVPFVDVLNTMLDDTLPLTPPEWPEWGNPIASPSHFDIIAGYSPYDNVSAKPYPAILALAGLTDPRVTYWEPAKWVARLRAATTSANPILLHTNMSAGHGGAAGRFKALKETAMIYGFALQVTGLSRMPFKR